MAPIVSYVKGTWSSVEDPSKWFDPAYQTQAAKQMIGGESPREKKAREDALAGQARAKGLAETERSATEAKAKAVADKVIADKEIADVESKKKATALRKRRKATYPYKTAGGEAGLLSGAPVLLKSLLGE